MHNFLPRFVFECWWDGSVLSLRKHSNSGETSSDLFKFLRWFCLPSFTDNDILRGGILENQYPDRRFLYGYRNPEIKLPGKPDPDPNVFLCIHDLFNKFDDQRRRPQCVSIGPHINAALPRPDTSDPYSLLKGIEKRMAFVPAPFKKYKRQRFRRFVKKWVRENLTPLDTTENFDFEEWLEGTNYPEWRKKELRACRTEIEEKYKSIYDVPTKAGNKWTEVKIFTKDEPYPEYKYFRAIWARSDYFKTIFGPICKKMEEKVFKLPYFIKKIPVKDRPQFIMDMVFREGYAYCSTDFSQFESHFDSVLMNDCEFELYEYLLEKHQNKNQIWPFIKKVLAGTNYGTNKYFDLTVQAKRMSGEMNTSLGNGFSNLMFLLFAAEEYDIEMTMPVVEGDDGLFGVKGNLPEQHFIDLGLTVKLEVHESINTASFCGLIFDPVEKKVITEPFKVLCETPWLGNSYLFSSREKLKGLLKSKALSICWQYPGCPIVYKYGLRLLTLLSDVEFVKPRYSYWESLRFENAMRHLSEYGFPLEEPGLSTRYLMEAKFGVSVENQLRIEADIDNMTLDSELSVTAELHVPQVWRDNYRNYQRHFQYNSMREIVVFPTAAYNKEPLLLNQVLDRQTLRKTKKVKLFN